MEVIAMVEAGDDADGRAKAWSVALFACPFHC